MGSLQEKTIVLLCFLLAAFADENAVKKCEHLHAGGSRRFPEEFIFGAATAAYQIEGGWNADGKGPSIWDIHTHNNPHMIDDRSNGDIAQDSYHRFEQDLAALKELGVKSYRFSIAWTRIFPNGDFSTKNQKGIDYYNKMIDRLLYHNIEPMVTMYHWDLPEELQKLGGWTNELIVDYFVSYADTLFEHFGDRVKYWITFNEPFEYCVTGYGRGNSPPLVHAPGVADYLCIDNTLKAHGVTYRMYRKKYFDKQRGKLGITLNTPHYLSRTNNATAVNRALQYNLGWLAHPIYSTTGNYPAVMIEDIARNSQEEGRPWSRLRPLNAEWQAIIKGSADFLGINYYSAVYTEEVSYQVGEKPSWEYDKSMETSVDENWRRAKSSWLYCVPCGMEGLLKWLRDEYNNVEVIITENGWSDSGELDDDQRIDYLKSHLQAILNARNDGCNVSGYMYWSLIDNFEWQRGYTEHFGLYYVNRTSPFMERIAKKSAQYYKKVIETRLISDEPESSPRIVFY